MSKPSIKNTTQLAEMFKALSNPNRLNIFLRLMSCCAPGTVCSADDMEKRCVGDLGADLNIAPSTLSHHIKELYRAGLVRMERRGQHVDCWVDPAVVEELGRFFEPGRK